MVKLKIIMTKGEKFIDNINYSEIMINKLKLSKYYNFGYITLIFIIIIISLINTLSFKTYQENIGVIIKEDNNYYLKTYISINNISSFIQKNYLNIKSNIYEYKIKYINSELSIFNNQNYQEVHLSLNLPKEYQINNLVINYKVLIKKQKIINYLKEIF